MWDSGELMGTPQKTRLAGVHLEDGVTYTLRLRLFNGVSWSDWADLTMRMNSLPTVPQPLEPQNGQIIAQMRPPIILKASSDAEGDPIYYEIQLYQDPDFTRVLGIEKELQADGERVRWTAPADLADDAEYYWRARARDPFETGPWSQTGQFWVNLVEEPPLPFGLLDPEIGTEVYLLEPVFSWEETFDPDPLSSVRYRVSYTRNPQFTKASTITLETDGTFIKAVKPLHNENTYYWKVEAVDNTGRITVSQQTGSFYVNTTPSIPKLRGPFAGEELQPGEKITWNPSTDPNPDDQIVYRFQMAENDFSSPRLEETLPATEVVINRLQGYDLLKDNVEYRFRVRAEDNHGIASKWSEKTGLLFFNQINDPPGPIAAPIQPDGIVVTDPQPIISWGAAQDPDRSDPPEKLSYLIQFDQDGDFSEGMRQVQVMAGVTRVAVPGLADNQEWHYRIRSRDDDGAVSDWSKSRPFILNTKNDPPLPFSLDEPADGWKTYHLTGIKFSWEKARDPDPLDSLHYRFKLAPGADLSTLIVDQATAGLSWTLKGDLDNDAEYVWWVEAVDLAGLSTPSSEKRRFTVSTTPSVPVPRALTGVVTGEELLQWTPSVDPDPNDRITYDLRIASTNDPNVELSALSDISATRAAQGIPATALPGLKFWKDNATYAFQVRAVDNHGASSDWSSPQEFYLDLVNESPQAPSLIEPSGKVTRKTEITVSWSAARDSDPSDTPETMTYRLQVIPGNDFQNARVQERAVLSGARSLTDLQLADNQLWSLRVRAEDRRGGKSPWSEPVELLVNLQEDPPSVPELSTPEEGAVLSSTDPVEFSWSAAQDPDYNAQIRYRVRWWKADDPNQVQSREVIGTSLTVDGLNGDYDYRWQVTAVDDTGLRTDSREGSFRVEVPNHPPRSFNLMFPENGQVEVPPRFEFTWQPALDNDPGDVVKYTLYLSKDEYFQTDLRTFEDLQGTKFAPPQPLEGGATYYWKVSAQDLKGEVVWGSTSNQKPFRFTVVLPGDRQEGEGE
jgi:chitodextrinase